MIREELGEDNSATEAEQFLETVKKLKAKKKSKNVLQKKSTGLKILWEVRQSQGNTYLY